MTIETIGQGAWVTEVAHLLGHHDLSWIRHDAASSAGKCRACAMLALVREAQEIVGTGLDFTAGLEEALFCLHASLTEQRPSP